MPYGFTYPCPDCKAKHYAVVVDGITVYYKPNGIKADFCADCGQPLARLEEPKFGSKEWFKNVKMIAF